MNSVNSNFFAAHNLITALITPFYNNAIDDVGFDKLLKHQIASKVTAVVVAGSTGEGSSLKTNEYYDLLKQACNYKNSIAIIAGCTASSTESAIGLALTAQKAGVSGLMCAVPPYVKATQEGLYLHFKKIHDATNIPIIIYSVPSRTGGDFAYDTITRLASLPRILGLKDAGGDLVRTIRLANQFSHNEFVVFAGDDITALAYNAQGAIGCISVASNVAPSMCLQIQNEWWTGNLTSAVSLHKKLLPLYQVLSLESNPICVKYALSCLGLCDSSLREPLILPSKENRKIIEDLINSGMYV